MSSEPTTEAGRDLLDHAVQYVPEDADRVVTGAKIAEVEAEAVAAYRTDLEAKVRALIEKAGGLCVKPDDYDPDSINICETHSEILFGDTGTCQDDPAQLRAVLRLLTDGAEPQENR